MTTLGRPTIGAATEAAIRTTLVGPPPCVPHPNSRAPIEDKPPMPKKPGTNPKGQFAFFNVIYEDDSVRSNRRVPVAPRA